ncbi:MAG: DUF421 domain-containing protein [Burkholderiales bacterium]|nr:DUF421 domain-containing protein [Burkholderiales bacterium]
MFTLGLPWWEFVVRGALVYIFLLIILRLTGKRNTGQLAPFDLVLLLVLSNAVQNSMNGGDTSLLGGIISAATLIGLHYCVAYLTFRSKALEKWVEGRPRTLIHNGVLDEKVMREELLTHHELGAALRAAGCAGVEHVGTATLENNGQITVSPRNAAG